MSEEEVVKRLAREIQQQLTEQGRAIEGGWRALSLHLHLERTGPIQQQEMRDAYYAGAQHLFSCIFSFLEAGPDATPKEVRQFELIAKELDTWYKRKKAEAKAEAEARKEKP